MKKLIYRKLLKDYMSFFFIALFSSGLIIWVFQAVNFLDIMIEDGREYTVYINYSLLNFPKILSRLFPFVLFFSIFYILSKYELNNELIIFWNFGENKINFINFILFISIFLFLIQITLTSLIVPKSQDKARSFLRNSDINFLGNFIKPKRFNDTIDGVTIYAERKDLNGNLYNLYIKKDLNTGFEITYANKGKFEENMGLPILVLYDGETIRNRENKITNFSRHSARTGTACPVRTRLSVSGVLRTTVQRPLGSPMRSRRDCASGQTTMASSILRTTALSTQSASFGLRTNRSTKEGLLN